MGRAREYVKSLHNKVELDMDEFIECNIDKRYEQKISKSNT